MYSNIIIMKTFLKKKKKTRIKFHLYQTDLGAAPNLNFAFVRIFICPCNGILQWTASLQNTQHRCTVENKWGKFHPHEYMNSKSTDKCHLWNLYLHIIMEWKWYSYILSFPELSAHLVWWIKDGGKRLWEMCLSISFCLFFFFPYW